MERQDYDPPDNDYNIVITTLRSVFLLLTQILWWWLNSDALIIILKKSTKYSEKNEMGNLFLCFALFCSVHLILSHFIFRRAFCYLKSKLKIIIIYVCKLNNDPPRKVWCCVYFCNARFFLSIKSVVVMMVDRTLQKRGYICLSIALI